VGFGRTSLELLILLEPNVVKIDGEFVRAAAGNASQQGALHRLARIIETLRADLVAEGIETDEHLAVVKDTGVAYGQGFVWGAPKSVQPVS
jgi:EAL domain-containing protein (putative c-di-GMP-specific phosphodiesterase class I)